MELERAKVTLATLLPFPPATASEAKNWLNNFWAGKLSLPKEHERSLLDALSVYSISEMDGSHANDIKRAQRSHGQQMRKKRTGSRRG